MSDMISMCDIAANLSLSLETVKKRLQRARTILKEGMDMAREFGVRSYKPEQIVFAMNGNVGKKGQPWSIITHLFYKNIFLETYENPETAEELSLELGIALPYMEDELEYLVREELLRKVGNKYETNFPIVSRDEQRRGMRHLILPGRTMARGRSRDMRQLIGKSLRLSGSTVVSLMTKMRLSKR